VSTAKVCSSVANLVCPLCSSFEHTPWCADKRREYFRCQTCLLIFVPAAFHLSRDREHAEYDLHQNSPESPAYRGFLSRLFVPVQAGLPPSRRGLDFGSGPGPTLSVMFQEAGHRMAIYDPYFAPDASVLTTQYDFVTASEVVEHLRDPKTDLARVWSCVQPGGLLGIMTKLALDQAAFASWHYKNDLTHVSFFSRETFSWLAAKWKAKLTIVGQDVLLFRR
jgi:hypothetical protein